jgi:hypothetical protein
MRTQRRGHPGVRQPQAAKRIDTFGDFPARDKVSSVRFSFGYHNDKQASRQVSSTPSKISILMRVNAPFH